MTTPVDEFSPDEWVDFYMTIGKVIFNSPKACMMAGHARPLNTVRDYLDNDPTRDRAQIAAKTFLVEFARIWTREDTKEVATRWHGSNPGAKASAQNAAGMPGLKGDEARDGK